MSDASGFIRVNAIDQPIKAIFLESLAWTRLEPQSISGDPEPGLEARIHDPLWLLARQWQLAEFEGEDVGTPLIVHMKTTELPVTAWQPGDPASDRPARGRFGVPLDPLVENEPPVAEIGLRQRAEAGAYLVELLAEEGLDARLALVEACPLPVESGTEPVSANFQIIARQTPDGFAAAEQLEAGAPSWLKGGKAKARKRPNAGSSGFALTSPRCRAKKPTIPGSLSDSNTVLVCAPAVRATSAFCVRPCTKAAR